MPNEFKAKNGVITPVLQSTVTTGTAPLTVASTTAVTNLNADLLDGQHGTYFINTSATAQTKSGNLTLTGTLSATSKSFLIDHPTKPGMQLCHGSLEGPENGVYVRGRLDGDTIHLPEYWTGLVDPNSITVQLTPVGKYQSLYVKEVKNNRVYVGVSDIFNTNISCFYFVQAERVDVPKLLVEI
jgi:hypothetical protein